MGVSQETDPEPCGEQKTLPQTRWKTGMDSEPGSQETSHGALPIVPESATPNSRDSGGQVRNAEDQHLPTSE